MSRSSPQQPTAAPQAPAVSPPPVAPALPTQGGTVAAPLSPRDQARLMGEQMRAMRDQARAMREGAMPGTTIIRAERPWGPSVGQERMIFGVVVVALVAMVAIVLPIARALGRRLERGGHAATLPSDSAERLQRIEQAVESIAIEVERISEAQRFTMKVMTKRDGEESARLIGEGSIPGR